MCLEQEVLSCPVMFSTHCVLHPRMIGTGTHGRHGELFGHPFKRATEGKKLGDKWGLTVYLQNCRVLLCKVLQRRTGEHPVSTLFARRRREVMQSCNTAACCGRVGKHLVWFCLIPVLPPHRSTPWLTDQRSRSPSLRHPARWVQSLTALWT